MVKNNSLHVLWNKNKPSQYKTIMYTTWIRKDRFPWKRINCTTTTYTLLLWGEGWYEIGVTAWNQWGESKLKQLKMIMISVNVSTGENQTVTTSTPLLSNKGYLMFQWCFVFIFCVYFVYLFVFLFVRLFVVYLVFFFAYIFCLFVY